jgi:hypothetical protein
MRSHDQRVDIIFQPRRFLRGVHRAARGHLREAMLPAMALRLLLLAFLLVACWGCSTIPGVKHVVLVCPDGKSQVTTDILPLIGSDSVSCANGPDGGVTVSSSTDISKPLAMAEACALMVIAAVLAL